MTLEATIIRKPRTGQATPADSAPILSKHRGAGWGTRFLLLWAAFLVCGGLSARSCFANIQIEPMRLLQDGQFIRGSYEVERFLGEGAFAEVYRVKHRFLGRQAMKVFKMAGMTREEAHQMLGEAIGVTGTVNNCESNG